MIKGISLERWLSLEDFENEQWKIIEGFNGIYEVSSYGRVKSHNYGTLIRKPRVQNNGYETVRLWINGKSKFYLIHRLVYSHFNGRLEDNLVIDHIDGNKTNNLSTNLQQISSRENTLKAIPNKLLRGVKPVNGGRYYTAHLGIKYKRYYLGMFCSAEEANKAYENALSNYKKYGLIPDVKAKKQNKIINGYKVCGICGINKPISEFQKCSGVYRHECKECAHKKQAKKRAEQRGDKPLYMHRKTWKRIKNESIKI